MTVDAPIGDSMLEVAHANNIDIEGAYPMDLCVRSMTAASTIKRRMLGWARVTFHIYTAGVWSSCTACSEPSPAKRLTLSIRTRSLRAGACGGETACSTCHIIVESKAQFDKLPEMGEAEEDMLDLAAGLTEFSRLGCQVFAAADLDGLVIKMPKEVNNLLGKD